MGTVKPSLVVHRNPMAAIHCPTSGCVHLTYIYRPGQEPEQRLFTETLSGEDVLVGFTMNVAEVK